MFNEATKVNRLICETADIFLHIFHGNVDVLLKISESKKQNQFKV